MTVAGVAAGLARPSASRGNSTAGQGVAGFASGAIQELQVSQQVLQVASFAAGDAWEHLSGNSVFAGIAA